MKKTGLLAVDLQEAFLCHPNLTPSRQELMSKVHSVLEWARARDMPIFHSHTKVKADGSDAMPHWRHSGGITCRADSEESKAPLLVAPHADEPIYNKRFYDPFESLALDNDLSRSGIENLLVVGVHTHACIRQAVLSAYSRGYTVTVVDAAIASYDPDHAAKTLDWLNGRAAKIVHVEELTKTEEIDDNRGPKVVIYNPCRTNEPLFEFISVGFKEIESLADDLIASQEKHSKMPSSFRTDKLQALTDLLKGQKSKIVELLVTDLGKPVRDAQAEYDYGISLLCHAANRCKDTVEKGSPTLHYQPLGLVAVITPWNNPFALALGKIAPAIGFGNAVIWKPASPALRVSQLVFDSISQVGLGDLIAVAPGGDQVGRWIVDNPSVCAVTFTGSAKVGKEIQQVCARKSNRFQGEMGASNAAVVLADADIKEAAADLVEAIFSFAGQRCTAIRRIIVDEGVINEFREHLISAINKINVGDPACLETQVGPVISSEAQKEFNDAVEAAVERGAKVIAKAELDSELEAEGAWFSPILLEDVCLSDPIWCEEQFGLLVVMRQCDGIQDAIEQSNKSHFGLLGAVYTFNRHAAERFVAESQVGIFTVNQARPSFSPKAPFGGWKDSGSGIAEHGRWNRDFYTRVKVIYE